MTKIVALACSLWVFTDATSLSLTPLQGRSRPLLIFAATLYDAKYLRQKEWIMRARSGIKERQMVPIEVFGNDAAVSPQDLGVPLWLSARKLRKEFGVPLMSFQILLIGKDGQVKSRVHQPTPLEDFFALVDLMPMRQIEKRAGE